jgi:hypothetical protein
MSADSFADEEIIHRLTMMARYQSAHPEAEQVAKETAQHIRDMRIEIETLKVAAGISPPSLTDEQARRLFDGLKELRERRERAG